MLVMVLGWGEGCYWCETAGGARAVNSANAGVGAKAMC